MISVFLLKDFEHWVKGDIVSLTPESSLAIAHNGLNPERCYHIRGTLEAILGSDFQLKKEKELEQCKKANKKLHKQVSEIEEYRNFNSQTKVISNFDEHYKKKSAYDQEINGKVIKLSECGKYARVQIDFYDLANELDLPDEAKHSIKKLWALGSRSGGKSIERDLKDCTWQNNRLIERLKISEALDG